MSCGHSWKDTTEASLACQRPLERVWRRGRTQLFSPVGKKGKLCYGKDSRKSLFLWNRERENLHGGWGRLCRWGFKGEKTLFFIEANSGSHSSGRQLCPLGGRRREGRGPQVGGSENVRRGSVGGQKTQIFQEGWE